ncbi:MAG: WD40 repeat domain-containing protein [Treponema sp.]|nr:WD40 repeat domain-containing protein [Treponema sp.]
MKKKNFGLPIIISIIFILLYVIFAAKPLAKEYQITPEWKIATSNPLISPSDKEQMYFHLGQTLGYFTEDGKITHFQTFPSKIAISNNYYATYDSSSKNIPFYFPNGKQAGIIEHEGYPYFVNELIFLMLPGGSSFSKCTQSGEIEWTYEGVLPITAFSTNTGFTAVGFVDGSISIFNNKDGSIISSYAPGGSDYPVILGIDISPDGQYVASISGHNQQRFVLSHKEENQQKIIYHTFLSSDSPYQTLIHFCKDGKRVLYNYQNNLGIYDLSTKENTVIKLQSKLIKIEENKDFIFLLGKNKKEYTVSIIEKTNTLLGRFSFTGDTAFIQTKDNDLYVGKDFSISKLSISNK